MGSIAYGLLTPTDADALEAALTLAHRNARDRHEQTFRVLEVGICHGDTSRGIRAFVGSGAIFEPLPLDFWCIDNGRDRAIEVPFPGATLILGPSEEVYTQVPGAFDFVLIDGCHCVNHVALDALHYGDRVKPGGLMMFHDTSPRAQGKLDWQGHGPKDHPDFGTASLEAVRLVGLLDERRRDWRVFSRTHDDQDWGGTLVVERLP